MRPQWPERSGSESETLLCKVTWTDEKQLLHLGAITPRWHQKLQTDASWECSPAPCWQSTQQFIKMSDEPITNPSPLPIILFVSFFSLVPFISYLILNYLFSFLYHFSLIFPSLFLPFLFLCCPIIFSFPISSFLYLFYPVLISFPLLYCHSLSSFPFLSSFYYFFSFLHYLSFSYFPSYYLCLFYIVFSLLCPSAGFQKLTKMKMEKKWFKGDAVKQLVSRPGII